MNGQLRIRRAKYGQHAGKWVVRTADAVIIGRFPNSAAAFDFVARFIRAATT